MVEKSNKELKELKAIIIPENFTNNLHPLTEFTNELLLPIASVPYIEYVVEMLLNIGITQIIFVLKNKSQMVKDYIKTYMRDITKKNPNIFRILVNDSLKSVGDCLREVLKENLINSDFILMRGLTITTFNLEQAIKVHLNTKEKLDKNCLITSIFKRFKNEYNIKTNYDSNILITSKDTKQILQYESIKSDCKKIKCNENIKFSMKPSESRVFEIKVDMFDAFIDICSPELLNHFNDNFDYKDLRDDLYANYLVSEMYLDTFYFYEIDQKYYCNTVKNLESYLKITFEIINRWAYPLFSLDKFNLSEKLGIKYVYSHNNVYLGTGKDSLLSTSFINLSKRYSTSDFRTTTYGYIGNYAIQVSADITTKLSRSVVGSQTILEPYTEITNSIIGKNCAIGKNTLIKNSIVFEDTTIEEDVEILDSVICLGTKISKGTKLKNCFIGSYIELNTDNKRLNTQNKTNFSNMRIYSEKNENPKYFTQSFNKVINENEDNLVDSDDQDKGECTFSPYVIITHEEFKSNLHGLDFKLACIETNTIKEDSEEAKYKNINKFEDYLDENEVKTIRKKSLMERSTKSKNAMVEDEFSDEQKIRRSKILEPEFEDFTESESEVEDQNDYYEIEIKAIFDKRKDPVNTTEELVILRKAYWDNTNAESKH